MPLFKVDSYITFRNKKKYTLPLKEGYIFVLPVFYRIQVSTCHPVTLFGDNEHSVSVQSAKLIKISCRASILLLKLLNCWIFPIFAMVIHSLFRCHDTEDSLPCHKSRWRAVASNPHWHTYV